MDSSSITETASQTVKIPVKWGKSFSATFDVTGDLSIEINRRTVVIDADSISVQFDDKTERQSSLPKLVCNFVGCVLFVYLFFQSVCEVVLELVFVSRQAPGATRGPMWLAWAYGELSVGTGPVVYANHKVVSMVHNINNNKMVANVKFDGAASNIRVKKDVADIMEFVAPKFQGEYVQFNQPHFLPTVATDKLFAMNFEVMGSDSVQVALLPGRVGASSESYEVKLGMPCA